MRAASTPLHRALCPERSRGPSMVEWVDRYALETFGLTPVETPPLLMPPESWLSDADTDRRILVFPTTPNPSKNFSLKGFTKLVDKLEANGWLADVVCMPDEKPQIAAIFGQSRTHTFPSLRELILHMMQSRAVISNDSGGGHLGSMLGLTTYTITKKTEDFVWRPGFNRNNRVISPVMTFKWITGRVWRPFIPLHRILNSLGKPPANRLTLETPLYKGHLPMRETITIQTPNGKQILAFKGDSITRQIQKHGEYDKNALDSIREVLSIIKPITSLDIGANIGNHSLVIAGLSERLFAFEPVDFVHAVLQQNLLNNGARNAVAVNIGLSLNAASKTIFVPKTHNVGCSSLEERGMHADRYDIRLIEGDTYVADNDIHDVDFIKIDIEGHEGEAIEGLRATILKNQPLVLMEWDQRTAGQFVDRHLFESLFAGYSAFSISQTDNKKIHPKTAHGRLRRLWFRLACKRWCLSKFDPRNGYRNVFLVPDRYLSAFSKFRYLADS